MNASLTKTILLLPFFPCLLNSFAAAQTFVAVKDGAVKRYDAKTGARFIAPRGRLRS